jgi:hypothetical protein
VLLPAILDSTFLAARVGGRGASDLGMAVRARLRMGSGGTVNVRMADPCLGAGPGSGLASALTDFSLFGRGVVRAFRWRNVTRSKTRSSRGGLRLHAVHGRMRDHAKRGLVGCRRRLGDGCGVVGFRCVGEEANIDCSVEGNSAGDRYQREQLQTQYTSRAACLHTRTYWSTANGWT